MNELIRFCKTHPVVNHFSNSRIFDLCDEMQDSLNKIFGDGFSPLLRDHKGELTSYPVFNSKECKDKWEIEIAAPGACEDDIAVTVEDSRMNVSYTKKQEEEKEESTYHHRALSFRSFERSWPLSSDIDVNNISAKLDKGVLVITLPKVKEKVPETKQIPVLPGDT